MRGTSLIDGENSNPVPLKSVGCHFALITRPKPEPKLQLMLHLVILSVTIFAKNSIQLLLIDATS